MPRYVAELGVAFVCARVGIPSAPRVDHSARGQLDQILKSESKALITAGARSPRRTPTSARSIVASSCKNSRLCAWSRLDLCGCFHRRHPPASLLRT
ncbi:hypothetical protein E5176_29395 [Ensifer adhaerens]|nr:hypothetical protein E5176_29395 [Ensifer adhaerens]